MTNREYLQTLSDWQYAIKITAILAEMKFYADCEFEDKNIMDLVNDVQTDFAEWLAKECDNA